MQSPIFNSLKFGMLGGGQLGRMLLQKAIDYNISCDVLDPDPEAPCKHLAHKFVQGSFSDFKSVYEFGKNLDILTIEIEHVNTEALFKLELEGVKVFPQPKIISLVQDKGAQKIFFRTHGIPTAEFYLIDSLDASATDHLSFPYVQKSRIGGYDGRGVMIIRSEDDFSKALTGACVLEKMIDFEREIAIIVARNENGETKVYPAVDMEFNPEQNLVEFLYSPSTIGKTTESRAQEIALKLAKELQIVGVLAVEMFLLHDGNVLVNEIAPRPHNSGHQTIEGNITSQYDQHLRAIFGLPLGNTEITGASVMVNLLGEKGFTGQAIYDGVDRILGEKGVYLHLYGKQETRPYRKMGHITVVSQHKEEAVKTAKWAKEQIRVISN